MSGGSSNSRVPKVLVSNATAVNTGNSAATAVDNDVILVDRTGTEVADTATLASNKNADVVEVILGKGVASSTSPNVERARIQVRNIRKVTVQNYVAPVQHVVTVDCTKATLAANTTYLIKVIYHDNHKIQLIGSEQTASWTSGSTVPTAADVAAGLKASIDAQKTSRVTATVSTGTLTLTGKAVTGINATELNNYMFQYFHVALRTGFSTTSNAASALGGTPGIQGKGAGRQVLDMERHSTASYYRNYSAFPSDDLLQGTPLRAVKTSGYNLVVIEHSNEVIGDLTQTHKAPQTLIIAFLTNAGAASAKQTAFVEKLTSLAEGTGDTYVSDIVPA